MRMVAVVMEDEEECPLCIRSNALWVAEREKKMNQYWKNRKGGDRSSTARCFQS